MDIYLAHKQFLYYLLQAFIHKKKLKDLSTYQKMHPRCRCNSFVWWSWSFSFVIRFLTSFLLWTIPFIVRSTYKENKINYIVSTLMDRREYIISKPRNSSIFLSI